MINVLVFLRGQFDRLCMWLWHWSTQTVRFSFVLVMSLGFLGLGLWFNLWIFNTAIHENVLLENRTYRVWHTIAYVLIMFNHCVPPRPRYRITFFLQNFWLTIPTSVIMNSFKIWNRDIRISESLNRKCQIVHILSISLTKVMICYIRPRLYQKQDQQQSAAIC